jgi:hypothetical protein
MRKPNPFETALLLLSLVESREERLKEIGKEGRVSRFRMSETTLKRLANRKRIPEDYLFELQEWLFEVDWSLFFTGSTYAMIKSDAIDGWVRLGSKRIADRLRAVEQGTFDFNTLSHLIKSSDVADDDGDEGK